MKSLSKYLIGLILIVLFNCLDNKTAAPIQYPIEPYIEFKDIKLHTSTNLNLDSIIANFFVRDGDFDLGLDPVKDINPPFNLKYYFIKNTGLKIADSDSGLDFTKLITYKDRKIQGGDTLPKFIHPYNCSKWEIRNISGNQDTIYFQFNRNYNNIFIEFYTLTNSNWVLYDWSLAGPYPICKLPWNFRFESNSINPPVKIMQLSSQDALFSAILVSVEFRSLFQGKKVKLKLHIQDRALHKSNEIETSEIQF